MTSDAKQLVEKRLTLQHQLAITPKTASLLLRCGYHDYRALQHASPNLVASQFQAIPGITKPMADGYRRAARRLVWLGTQEAPEEHAKVCKDWTNKALVGRGMWRDGFDDLTGVQIDELMGGGKGGKMKAKVKVETKVQSEAKAKATGKARKVKVEVVEVKTAA